MEPPKKEITRIVKQVGKKKVKIVACHREHSERIPFHFSQVTEKGDGHFEQTCFSVLLQCMSPDKLKKELCCELN